MLIPTSLTNKHRVLFSQIFVAGPNLPDGIEPLFASERNGNSFSYSFDVSEYPDGSTFKVILWMAEIFHNDPGKRAFDVAIESKQVIDDLDLLQDIGAKFTAKNYTYEAVVIGGELNIEFTGVVDKAKVSGIEIRYDATKDPVDNIPTAAPQPAPVAPPPTLAPTPGPPAVVARVNCGSNEFAQTDGTVWSEDTFHTGGTDFTNSTVEELISKHLQVDTNARAYHHLVYHALILLLHFLLRFPSLTSRKQLAERY